MVLFGMDAVKPSFDPLPKHVDRNLDSISKRYKIQRIVYHLC